MTPKEKAEELVRKYYTFGLNNPAQSFSWYECKQCALIAVDECLESTKQLIHHYTVVDDKRYADIYLSMSLSVNYWKQVKQEIEKL